MNVTSLWWLLVVVAKFSDFVHANWITGNLCWSMPCMNGGSCFGSAYTYLCVCPVNYSGALCEKRLGICQESPCGNRGLCVETKLNSFECRCYFDYMGPLCEEHVPKNDPAVWSSLIPVHTRVLFDILQEAYRGKARGRSAIIADNDRVDFLSLLPTNRRSSSSATISLAIVESTSIKSPSETTEKEHVIGAENIQLEKIFPDISTASTHDMQTEKFTTQVSQTFETIEPFDSDNDTIISTYSEPYTSSSMMTLPTEHMTTESLEQNYTNSLNITEDQELINITEQSSTTISLTSIDWSSDNSNNHTITYTMDNSTEQIMATTESGEFITNTTPHTVLQTSFETNNYLSVQTDDNLSNTLEQTSIKTTIEQSLTIDKSINTTQTAHSQLLYRLCQQLLSHLLPNISSSTAVEAAFSLATNSSSSSGNSSADALLTWIKQQFLSSTTTITTTTTASSSLPSFLINGKKILQRVDMDDVLYQMNNNIDEEHQY